MDRLSWPGELRPRAAAPAQFRCHSNLPKLNIITLFLMAASLYLLTRLLGSGSKNSKAAANDEPLDDGRLAEATFERVLTSSHWLIFAAAKLTFRDRLAWPMMI